MTRTAIVRWTCNTCGDQMETDSTSQPKGWVGYGFTEPDVPAGEHRDLGHLCASCARSINEAMGRR